MLNDTRSPTPGYDTTGGSNVVAPRILSMTAADVIAGTPPRTRSIQTPRFNVTTSFSDQVSCP